MDQLIKDCRNHLSHIARKEFDKLEHAMREELARRMTASNVALACIEL